MEMLEIAVGDFVRIDPRGKSDRQLLVAALQQAEATHGCLEKHRAETQLAYLDATEKRQALAEDVLGLRNDVIEVKEAHAEDRKEIQRVALAIGTREPEEGEEKPPAPRFHIGWKELFKIATGIGGSMGLFILLFQLAAKILPVVYTYLMGLSPT